MTESELSEREAFFKDFDFPAAVDLAPFERVLDPRKFVDSHITILRARLGELLVALVAKHGLNQLLHELMDNSETTAILDIVYDADDDTTRTWAIDKFASESE